MTWSFVLQCMQFCQHAEHVGSNAGLHPNASEEKGKEVCALPAEARAESLQLGPASPDHGH